MKLRTVGAVLWILVAFFLGVTARNAFVMREAHECVKAGHHLQVTEDGIVWCFVGRID